MPRVTKAELEQDNAELRDKLAEIYDEVGELLGVDQDDEQVDEESDEN